MPNNKVTQQAKSHTPEPWTYEPVPETDDPELQPQEGEVFWIVDQRAAGEVLATVLETSRGEGEANARVMTLAPAFLKALRHALPYLRASAPLFLYQTAGQEFYPNREEAEAIVTEVEGVLRKADGGER